MVLLSVAISSKAEERIPRYFQGNEAGSSAAVLVGDWPLAHTAQAVPVDESRRVLSADPQAQAGRVLDNLHTMLVQAQSGLDRAVKLNFYVTRDEILPDVKAVLAARFHGAQRPAVAFVVTPLPIGDALVAADAVAVTTGESGNAVELSGAKTGQPATVAVVPDGTRIYIAGQAEPGTSLAEATRKTLESLRTTLKFLGRGDADMVQLKAFLTPMSGAAEVRREVEAFFGDRPAPPLVLVEWKSAAKTPIEIELIAWGGKNRTGDVVEYLTPPGMSASPVFSRVARINHSRSIYVSGLFAPAGSADTTNVTAERDVTAVFSSLQQLLQQTGSDFRHLAKATYYVSSEPASMKLNELRPKYYDPERPPAASKAAVAGVGQAGAGLTLDMIAVPAVDDAIAEYGPPEYGHGLSAEDAAAGWISLFDGRTTFGWSGAKIEASCLAGGATSALFGNCELRANFARGGTIHVGGRERQVPAGDWSVAETSPDSDAVFPIQLGDGVVVRLLAVRPLGLAPIFNGKDLRQWERIDNPNVPESKRPAWEVRDGAIHAVGGPGCVEFQEGRFGDLVLQLDVRTLVRHANGGVFFRAIPGDFMNGYEAQVFNRSENSNPARPATYCTGALDDRQNARRMVSRDGHFYRMTVLAHGPHLATWINGYQQTDFTDTRPEHENPRQGLRMAPGVIQLQAHDPETDVEFKDIAARAW